MTIEGMKFFGLDGFDVTCDVCDQTTHFDDECFEWLLSSMKKAGWTSKRVDGEWENYCPDCGRTP